MRSRAAASFTHATCASDRVRLDERALLGEANVAGYAILCGFLDLQKLLTDHLKMRPTHATVYLTVVVSSIRCVARRPAAEVTSTAVTEGPYSDVGWISRRAVAEMTGLPRETVRRIVCDLIEGGLVTPFGRYGVTLNPADLDEPDAQSHLRDLARELARLFDKLLRLGVLRAPTVSSNPNVVALQART